MEENLLYTVEQAIERRAKTRDKILSIEKTALYQVGSCHVDVNELRKCLQQSLGSIKDAFESNCEQELNVLNPILGRLPTNGLILHNKEARKELDEVMSLCTHEGMDDLSRERLETMITYITSRTRALCDRIVHIINAQEIILETTKKALHQGVR